MENKELKDKAILLKGKQYVLVADRVRFFNEEIKGNIQTEITHVFDGAKGKIYVVKATATSSLGVFTGHSQAEMGQSGANFTAALENAETSAVGRALGFMGIGVIDSVASADELHKAGIHTPQKAQNAPRTNENAKVCSLCGSEAKVSPKSGKDYCPNWKMEDHSGGVFYEIITKGDKAFEDSLPVIEQ